jgi:toxin FitB
MTERRPRGVLDTSVVIDFAVIDEAALPLEAAITAVTLAELSQGPHLARGAQTRASRVERLQVVESVYRSPLPFDAQAARRYGALVGLVLAVGRQVRPRRIDLMIAAIASSHGLPLYTRNPQDLDGLEGLLDVVAV